MRTVVIAQIKLGKGSVLKCSLPAQLSTTSHEFNFDRRSNRVDYSASTTLTAYQGRSNGPAKGQCDEITCSDLRSVKYERHDRWQVQNMKNLARDYALAGVGSTGTNQGADLDHLVAISVWRAPRR
jgi:hypothetical protein